MVSDGSIKDTTKATKREFIPVLINQKGVVVDGKHRLQFDPKWKKTKIHLTPLETHVARLVINATHRDPEQVDYLDLAAFLAETEPGKEPYRVKTGETVAQRISNLTGVPERTVRKNLEGTRFVRGYDSDGTAELGVGERVRIYAPLVPGAERVQNDLRKVIAAAPERKEEMTKLVVTKFAEVHTVLKDELKKEKDLKIPKARNVTPEPQLEAHIPTQEHNELKTILHGEEPENQTNGVTIGGQIWFNITTIFRAILRETQIKLDAKISIAGKCEKCQAETHILFNNEFGEVTPQSLVFTVSKAQIPELAKTLRQAPDKVEALLLEVAPAQ